jgi:hypothetical protein
MDLIKDEQISIQSNHVIWKYFSIKLFFDQYQQLLRYSPTANNRLAWGCRKPRLPVLAARTRSRDLFVTDRADHSRHVR